MNFLPKPNIIEPVFVNYQITKGVKKKIRCSRCKQIADPLKVVRILCVNCYLIEREEIKKDEENYPGHHFTVFKMTAAQRASLYRDQTPENIKKFEDAQKLRREMPKEMRDRSERDRGYRVGIVDGAVFIKSQMDKIQAEV